jgi:eukaryotic translation initiation factor 2C
MGDKNGNVVPGTVVENRADGQDIFLVPHVGLQGTVRPTRYISLLDENRLTADEFQRICNSLSYSYARSTCAVSSIPAVYYAGLACAKAKDHVHENGAETKPVHSRLTWSMVCFPLLSHFPLVILTPNLVQWWQ